MSLVVKNGNKTSRKGGRTYDLRDLGKTRLGKATALEREDTTLVIKAVPAQVCANCGEEYVDEETTSDLLKIAEEAARAGVQVDVRQYTAA